MSGIWLLAAVVVASSVPMGTFNGAHALAAVVMVVVTIAAVRKDTAAWRRVDRVAVEGDLRGMDDESDTEAFRKARRTR